MVVSPATVIKVAKKAQKLLQCFGVQPSTEVPYRELVTCATLCDIVFRNLEAVKKALVLAAPGSFLKEVSEKMTESPIFYEDPARNVDTQGYLFVCGEKAYLVFRGSDSSADAMTNIDIRCKGLMGSMKVHTGFYRQFAAVQEKVMADLEARGDIKELICTGHSLGGAIATLAAAHLGGSEQFTVKCYTFGAPRVGNKPFVKWFHERVVDAYRVTNSFDPVPLVPLFLYWHTRNQLMLADNRQVKFIKKDFQWFFRPCVSLANIDILQPVKEHDCFLYINRLKALLGA